MCTCVLLESTGGVLNDYFPWLPMYALLASLFKCQYQSSHVVIISQTTDLLMVALLTKLKGIFRFWLTWLSLGHVLRRMITLQMGLYAILQKALIGNKFNSAHVCLRPYTLAPFLIYSSDCTKDTTGNG
jgi:hypothetical protein